MSEVPLQGLLANKDTSPESCGGEQNGVNTHLNLEKGESVGPVKRRPLSSEVGKYKTDTARLWPWLSGKVTSGDVTQDKKRSRCHLPRVVYHQVYNVY